MTDDNQLLVLDTQPVEKELVAYFSKFNIDIIQKPVLPVPNELNINPAAILINWALLKDNPQALAPLYHRFTVPIIVIIDRNDDKSCIMALEAGADDFLIKPINPRELHARISAINRRVLKSKSEKRINKDVLVFGNWRLYPASRQVFGKDNKELILSAGEYDLLFAFAQQPQQILHRDYLLQITKQTEQNPLDRRVDVQISRLRQKIEPDAGKHVLIRTIRNRGYMFTAKVLSLKESDL